LVGGRSSVTGYGQPDGLGQRFTGKERDAESGLDYFGARYYSSAQGRFTSVDPAIDSAVLTQPQSWNRYAYVLNNPLTIIDPDGKAWVEKGDGAIGWDASIDEHAADADEQVKRKYGPLARVLRSGTIRIITAAPKRSPWAPLVGHMVILTEGGVMLDMGPARSVSPEEINFWAGYGQQFLAAYLKEAAINVIGALTGAAAVRAIEYIAEAARATKVVSSTLKILQNLCFVAGTRIITSTQSRPIEELKPGDEVLAGDPECGTLRYERVINATVTSASTVVDICVEGVMITCTPEHPLWVVGEGWTEAARLRPLSSLMTKDGSRVRVESVSRRDGSFKVFNLEVEHLHTYFVSDLGVLAHNSCRISPVAGDWATKGAHISVDGVELAVRPGAGGTIVFKPVFSSTKAGALRSAIREAENALQNDPQFQQALLRSSRMAVEYLGKSESALARARSGEVQFLVKALEKMGIK
jgi:RHS repeat-associated protein